ncbi:MAG TPA: hypothetical protein VFE89_07325 [Beijerinckiaceae bacterium]|jgi:hypothetical protein|nr:hypothetical protein [Beijerinckiaceae bacterium]
MRNGPFATPIERSGNALTGPWRAPLQMLAEQQYDEHASIHDDATAQKLGFRGGTIEGPTHFSQFAPLGFALWGERWFSEGCISAHYRNAVYEGERVRAIMTRAGEDYAVITMEKEDGTEVLRGSASVGSKAPPSALEERLKTLPPPGTLVILRDIRVGHKTSRRKVEMSAEQNMGALYPFSLQQKLTKITEPSPWYEAAGANASPFGRPIVPVEMISVLLNYTSKLEALLVRDGAIGLFADQEIRLIKGPLFVGEPYDIEREVVALSGSKRTESMWIKTSVYALGSSDVLATMLLNIASLKDSYANYAAELAEIEAAA